MCERAGRSGSSIHTQSCMLKRDMKLRRVSSVHRHDIVRQRQSPPRCTPKTSSRREPPTFWRCCCASGQAQHAPATAGQQNIPGVLYENEKDAGSSPNRTSFRSILMLHFRVTCEVVLP